jgi:hypothetical protein
MTKPADIVTYRRRPREDEILCHNAVLHTRDTGNGWYGFRWFVVKTPAPWWEVCPCGWRPDLGVHHARADVAKFWRDLHEKFGTQEAVDRWVCDQLDLVYTGRSRQL